MFLRKQFILICSGILMLHWAVSAQLADTWTYRHFTTEDGLSNDVVTSMVKDKRGFLWVGTKSGLNRFDGREFLHFFHRPDQANSLPGNFITDLATDRQGNIWVTTTAGVCKLDPDKLRFERMKFSAPKTWYSEVYFDKKGKGWVVDLDSIYAFDPQTMRYQSFGNGKKLDRVFDARLDSKDRIWLATDRSVYAFDTQRKTVQSYLSEEQNAPPDQPINFNIQTSQEGKVFFYSQTGNLLSYDEAADRLVPYPQKLGFQLDFLLPDKDLNGKPFLWAGGGSQRLLAFYPEKQAFYPIKFLTPTGGSTDLFEVIGAYKDPSNKRQIWVATFSGLTQLTTANLDFSIQEFPLGNEHKSLMAIKEIVKDRTDPSGNNYFLYSYPRTLYSWNKAEKQLRTIAETGVPHFSNRVGSMIQDSKGMVWVGDVGQVKRYDPRTKTLRIWEGAAFPLPPGRGAICIFEDKSGTIWFGTSVRKLLKFNPSAQSLDTIPIPGPQPNGPALVLKSITQDSMGNLWLMATTNQLIRFNPKTLQFNSYSIAVGEKATENADIRCDKNGRLWLAADVGLLEIDYHGKVLRQFTQANGLKSEFVSNLVDDAAGRIWIGSDNLLHCLNPATNTFTYFGKRDGLKSNNILYCLSKAHDGEIMVGFEHAFCHFDPQQLRLDMEPPPVAITSLRVMKEERSTSEPVVLRPGENFLSVAFTALNFSLHHRNQYAYRLESFDQDWVYTDNPIATYTNLDGGDYVLHLKAANSDGIWNEAGVRLPVKVIAPLHKRWYFRLGLLLLAGAVVASVVWMRQQPRRRLEAFRESLARDLHDEMGSTLSSIRFFSEFAQNQVSDGNAAASLPILQRISASVSTAADSMQDIIWAMKSKDDSLDNLATRMTEFGLRLLESRNISFKTYISDDFVGKHLNPEQRRNIYLIFKEAVNNAAKYAEASEVELFLGVKRGILVMKISDNGKGFDPNLSQANGSGNGLQNMRQRAGDIGGALEITSKPGEGSRVELRLRI